MSESKAKSLLAELHAYVGENEEGDEERDVEADLLACQVALKVSLNEYVRARAYLFSNRELLREAGREEKRLLNEKAVPGLYEDKLSRLKVNLLTGEVFVNSQALMPVPSRVSTKQEYTFDFGRSARWCSLVDYSIRIQTMCKN